MDADVTFGPSRRSFHFSSACVGFAVVGSVLAAGCNSSLDRSGTGDDGSRRGSVDAEAPLTVGGTVSRVASGPRPVDVNQPDAVVGDGSAASCSERAARTAIARGGVIVFNCGTAAVTITLGRPLVASADEDTTIDGGDLITLDGQNTTQILRVESQGFRANAHVLAVQRLTMTRGNDRGTGYRSRQGDSLCAWGYRSGGGGAIYAKDVNVRVWGSTFLDNHGPQIGPDVAGGAIYVLGAQSVTVNNSVFRNNSASNGGAIGLLHTSAIIHNSVFEGNQARGTMANYGGVKGCPSFNHPEQGGSGGLGGAFYSDGFDRGDEFWNVHMVGNRSNSLGGAVFRSAYWGLRSRVAKQTIRWENSTFERNRSLHGGGGGAYVNNSLFILRNVSFDANDGGNGDGGGLKITGVTLRASDVSFSNNRATVGGGVAFWGSGLEGTGSATDVRQANNAPDNGVGLWAEVSKSR